MVLILLFFIALVVYVFVGYGVVLYILVKLFPKRRGAVLGYSEQQLPSLTLIVAAYNEAACMEEKIQNCLELEYPAHLLHIFFVTDGSTDSSEQIVARYPRIRLFHEAQRKGKIAAVHRVMQYVETEIVVFTDANTLLNKEALVLMARHYADAGVGAVSGEKRIRERQADDASGAGEGFYWKYESKLKQWDSDLNTVVGAAGELFSIRTSLYQPVPPDSIIEDFVLTIGIAMRGYRVVYEPNAYAVEPPSASSAEEFKRKVRIAAGGWQTALRLQSLVNPFRYGVLSFQYISHRLFRWTLAPFLLPFIFFINAYMVWHGGYAPFFTLLMVAQVVFYLFAAAGAFLEHRKIKFKLFFIPYYFCLMNYAVWRGFFRFLKGNQSVLWEKAKRSND